MMFNLFSGATASQVNEALAEHYVNYATVLILLIEKGIVTPEEVKLARIKAIHAVDQLRSSQQEQSEVQDWFGKLTDWEQG